MSSSPELSGTLSVALDHARRLLRTDPNLVVGQVQEILAVFPKHPIALLLLGTALRITGDNVAAVDILERLIVDQPNSAATLLQLGLCLEMAGQHERALGTLRRAVALKPDLSDAWRAIGDQLTARGDSSAADAAYAQQIRASTKDPKLLTAAAALCANRIPEAEARIRAHLKQHPTDVAAIRMFAEIAGRLGRFQDAETLLARCLDLAPSFHAARHNYVVVLHRQNKSASALLQIGRLTASEPHNPGYRNLKAVILANIGNYEESLDTYAGVLKQLPDQPKIWMSYGHALAAAGREAETVAAYRRSIQLARSFGEAYWSLANLKTFRFAPDEVVAMKRQLERDDLAPEDRFHFHFALAKAMEDSADYPLAFDHYVLGNRLRRADIDYDADETTRHVRRSKSLFTVEYFEARAGYGARAPDPIFIVGLPRSGSTLIEQILASHSAIEGTMELPDIPAMAHAIGATKTRGDKSQYPEILASLNAEESRALGERYIEQTRIQRNTTKPFFIDKMPNNFLHIGLILQIIPNAKIVDARRQPVACCFSAFKQHFARGQHFTYDLVDIARYYRDYVDLMAHFDEVVPARVHRVFYEKMIEDTEDEIRRLLAYCGLPFEPSCLRFYANDRAVRTASKQQVRQPIFRDGVEHWRHFEPWLGVVKDTLGTTLDSYPVV